MKEDERSCNKFHHFMRSLAHQPNHAKYKDIENDEEGWCGPACVEWVCRQEGILYTQSQLARIMGTTHEEGTSHREMVACAREVGLTVFEVEGYYLQGLPKFLSDNYVIVNWMNGSDEKNDGHYSVVQAIKDDMIYLMDTHMKTKEFEKQWYDIETSGRRSDKWAMIIQKAENASTPSLPEKTPSKQIGVVRRSLYGPHGYFSEE